MSNDALPVTERSAGAIEELEKSIYTSLETYSNVHRGSGFKSKASTQLYEQAREIVLGYLNLPKSKYTVIFSSPRRAKSLMAHLDPSHYQCVTSREIGLSLGVSALAVKKRNLPKGAPDQSGGGTTRLIAADWVIWANGPDRFEPGTPAIINVIAFARALRMIQGSGKGIFRDLPAEPVSIHDLLYRDELEGFTGEVLLEKLRKTRIGREVRVPTTDGEKPFINLDSSASTPTFEPVWNAFRHAYRQPASVEREMIREVKSICANFLGAPLASYDVIFASNTTEAINLAAESLGQESREGIEPVVLNTLLEHSSNDLPWRMIPGCTVIRLSIDQDGVIDMGQLQSLLSDYNRDKFHGIKRIRVVAVSGASNVLGICNDLEEISRVVHQYGARLLVDAAQLVAHRNVEMERLGIDYLAFSAHKIYAPFGTGVLMAKKGLLAFDSVQMEGIRSSGEENAGGIAAMGKAMLLMQRIGLDVVGKEEQALTRKALVGMSQIPGIRIYGVQNPDSPLLARRLGVIVFGLKGVVSFKVAKQLSGQGGIGVRVGCHCAHILIKHLLGVSPFLIRLQRTIILLFPKLNLPGLVRVSIGIENTPGDVDTLLQVLGRIAKR